MTEAPFMVRVAKYLPWIEAIFLIALGIGLIFLYQSLETTLLIIALFGLTIIYALSAYKPIEIVSNGDEKFGMKELLAWTIVPKVCWISCGVSTLGWTLFFVNTGNEGYKNMILIGAFTIASAIVVTVFLTISGTHQTKILAPALFRAVPLLSADCYLLYIA
jgi:hypothetical protein